MGESGESRGESGRVGKVGESRYLLLYVLTSLLSKCLLGTEMTSKYHTEKSVY